MNAVPEQSFGFDPLDAILACQLGQHCTRVDTRRMHCAADVLHEPICQSIETFYLQACDGGL